MDERTIQAVLVVDDDAALVRTLERALAPDYPSFASCADVRSALRWLAEHTPDLLLLDVGLPDGSAFDVLEALQGPWPMPLIVAISGQATAEESFRLAQLGVHGYLSKPFGLEALREAIEVAKREPLDLRPQIRESVGLRSLHEVEAEVRDTMLEEALARSQGCRRGAARLLDVSRQMIQHMVRQRNERS